jgi:hypothetical protein
MTCPHCGAARGADSEYCTGCGLPRMRMPGRAQILRDRFSGNSVWPVLMVLLLAALGALVAIAVSRGDDGRTTLVATRLPARTTVPRVPIFGTDTTATTVLPVVTTTPPPVTTTAKRTTLTEWTIPDGYTLVLASVPRANGRASAVQIAKRALAQDLPEVGVLDSKDFSGLHPGYFVVFSGIYKSNSDASSHLSEAQKAGFAAPYARRITR